MALSRLVIPFYAILSHDMLSNRFFGILSIGFGIVVFAMGLPAGVGVPYLALAVPGLLAGIYALYRKQCLLGAIGTVLCAIEVIYIILASYLNK